MMLSDGELGYDDRLRLLERAEVAVRDLFPDGPPLVLAREQQLRTATLELLLKVTFQVSRDATVQQIRRGLSGLRLDEHSRGDLQVTRMLLGRLEQELLDVRDASSSGPERMRELSLLNTLLNHVQVMHALLQNAEQEQGGGAE